MLGGSITGLIFKMNMGLRGALVGAGAGGVLGGLCGGISVLILKLAGVTVDEVLDSQKQWMESRAKWVLFFYNLNIKLDISYKDLIPRTFNISYYVVECISYKVTLIVYFNTLIIDMFNNYRTRDKIKECMGTELMPEIKKLYEENRRLQNIQQEDIENQKKWTQLYK